MTWIEKVNYEKSSSKQKNVRPNSIVKDRRTSQLWRK